MARSAKKGPFIDDHLLKKVQATKASGKREVIKTWSRRSIISPDFVGMNFAVHDGRKFISVFITENMVGHRMGEFAPTRTFRLHSGQRKAGAQAK
jgi:small subunit ribosomal protein S19